MLNDALAGVPALAGDSSRIPELCLTRSARYGLLPSLDAGLVIVIMPQLLAAYVEPLPCCPRRFNPHSVALQPAGASRQDSQVVTAPRACLPLREASQLVGAIGCSFTPQVNEASGARVAAQHQIQASASEVIDPPRGLFEIIESVATCTVSRQPEPMLPPSWCYPHS